MAKKTKGASQKVNPDNIFVAVEGLTFVSFVDEPSKIKPNGTFGDDWETLGILEDGSKLELNRTIERTATNGWGYANVSVSSKPGELSGTVSVLEDNPTVRRLMWADTVEIDGVTIEKHSGKEATAYVAYFTKNNEGEAKIRVSRKKAYLSIEDLGEQEETFGRSVNITFMPDGDKGAFESAKVKLEKDDSGMEVLRFETPVPPITKPGASTGTEDSGANAGAEGTGENTPGAGSEENPAA